MGQGAGSLSSSEEVVFSGEAWRGGKLTELDDPDSILWNWGQRAGASEPCVAAGKLTSSLPIPGPGLIP